MSNDQDYEKYDHAEAIRQQIKHVNHLMTAVESEERQSFQQYFNKVFLGLASLENMVSPFGYESELEDENPHKMDKSESIQLLRDAHAEIMEFLYEENLFYAQRTGRTKV